MKINKPGCYKTIEGDHVEILAVTENFAIGHTADDSRDDNVWDRGGHVIAPDFEAQFGMSQIVELISAYES